MSRLIDADDLFKAITEGKYTTGNILKDMELQQFIKEQPTAYDVEKVVAELKKEEIALEDNFGDYVFCVPTRAAIDIVKRGGVE